MTDAPASASRAVAPFSFLGADHPSAVGLGRFAARVDTRPPRDPAALAAELARVLGDPGARAAMAAAGRERAPAFSWDRSAGRRAGIYDAVLDGRR